MPVQPVLDLRHPLRRPRARLASRRALDRLGDASTPLHDALRAAIGGNALPEEREWIEHIERRRADLEESPGKVAMTDYGAGTPAG
jgi:hypothetical protein